MNRLLFAGVGFTVWLLATIAHRVAGQVYFQTDNAPVIIAIWLVTFIAQAILIVVLFSWQGLNKAQRYEATLWTILPAMFLDAFVLEFYATVFPNMAPLTAGNFGGWLLWAYSTIVIVGLWSASRVSGAVRQ